MFWVLVLFIQLENMREPGLSLDVGHAEFEGPSKEPGEDVEGSEQRSGLEI